MNETLIKRLVKYKLNAADAIIENLPEKMSKELKALGIILIESINESYEESKKGFSEKVKEANKVNSVTIE